MATTDEDREGAGPAEPLSPDEAFAVLGNEVRLEVLRTLAAAEGPLPYATLYDRVDYDDPSNFSYHLDKLVGHFVSKTDDGYRLYDAGRRIVEAVVSGAVADDTVVEPTAVDKDCPFCGAPVAVGFHHGRVEQSCTECAGLLRFADSGGRRFTEDGSLGYFLLPPAGAHGRSPQAMLEAAWTWRHADFLTDSAGVCSRCAAPLETAVEVCERHDADDGVCEACGARYAMQFQLHCGNCDYNPTSIAPGVVLANTAFLEFLLSHGINPVAPDSLNRASQAMAEYDEEVVSTDPFEARLTFTIDGDTLTLTLDDDLTVVDTETDGEPEQPP
jgi:DNA-binding transcriptional ArsR family regulator